MKTLLLFIVISALSFHGIAQTGSPVFDTARFDKNLQLANQLISHEYYTQLAIDKFSKQEDISTLDWFSYFGNNTWHTVGGNNTDRGFKVIKHVIFDSLNTISEYTGKYDTLSVNASASALSQANTKFKLIRDTCNFYFNSFVYRNTDQTISVWFLPAFQPSGQALYGCEWEYIFDKSGKQFLRQNSFTNIITGVWIGQPRELWLNYRNTDKPTTGSVFFAQSFRDYFTRIRIDTHISTSTITKDASGKYAWTHKMK